MRIPLRSWDRTLGIVGALAALTAVMVLVWIVADLFRLGWPHLSGRFLSAGVEESGRSGGIGPVIVSTALILAVCLGLSIPLGVGCAVWLSEFAKRDGLTARVITGGVDMLASVPSIVFGLFGMAFFCQTLHLGYSILSGGLTLGLMILPILVRTTLSSLRHLPDDLRPAAYSLGLSRTTVLREILLPVTLPGVLVGVTLGTGRALSETAALIFTSGYSTRWPQGLSDSGRALSVHIYDLAMNIPNGTPAASASALVLLLSILIVNFSAIALGDWWIKRRTGNFGGNR